MAKHRAASLIPAVLLALAGVFGCLPDPGARQALGPAPRVDADAPDAETAFWREQYVKNRTVPPREFSVAQKPPRNNDFGEFDDALHAGLDRQPDLPELPGGQDLMPMFGGPAGYPVPAATLPPGYRAESASHVPGVEPPVADGNAAVPAGGAGISAGTRYYPIEQLVFGGDYPDLDKPEEYRLMPKDVISVTVRDHPEFSGKLEIQPDGTVRVPNTPDTIRLRGLAVAAAQEEIRRRLQIYVKGECRVSLQTNRARGGYYFVFGDVGQPGRFPMGLEPVRLSDAVLAANWEANPNRMDAEEELGPAFPAAGPRGKFISPRTADLARVMLITPHRSQPVRTVHDLRSALLGMTHNDPAIRPGQIILVPSLDPRRNLSLGLDLPETPIPPDSFAPAAGFSSSATPARLPRINPDWSPGRREQAVEVPAVESNMMQTYEVQSNTEAVDPYAGDCAGDYGYAPVPAPPVAAQAREAFEDTRALAGGDGRPARNRVAGVAAGGGRKKGRRLARAEPGTERRRETAGAAGRDSLQGWGKGF